MREWRWIPAAALGLAVAAWGRPVAAQDDASEEAPDPDPGWDDVPAAPPRAHGPITPPPRTPSTATVDDRRPMPAMGRPGDEDDAGDGAIWIPRVAFFPVWAVTEYLVRKPLEASFLALEEVGILEAATDEPPKPLSATDLAFAPAAQVDAGFQPMFGVYGRVDNVVVEGWEVRGLALFGGVDAMKAHIQANAPLAGDSRAWVEAGALRRDDLLYWGRGPRTVDENQSTWGMESLDARVSVHVPLLRGDVVFLEAWMRGTLTEAGNGDCDDAITVGDGPTTRFACASPTLYERVEAGALGWPPGLAGYGVVGIGTRFGVDLRPNRRGDTGMHFEVYGEQNSDVEAPSTGAWLRWGGVGTASIDVTGTDRVLSLRLDTRFVEGYGRYEVPIPELVGAPGLESDPERELLRGFRPGRLLGESAIATALEYRWPIWTRADARLEAGLGNAFDRHLRDFETDLLRFSLSGGIEVPIAHRHRLLFLAGFGTETFDQGADPTSARIYVGGTTPL